MTLLFSVEQVVLIVNGRRIPDDEMIDGIEELFEQDRDVGKVRVQSAAFEESQLHVSAVSRDCFSTYSCK